MTLTNRMESRLRRLAELITFPTTLSAAAADLGTTEAQCLRWMRKWPEEYRRFETEARRGHERAASDEALRVLRTQMRSPDRKVREAAAKVIADQIGLPDGASGDEEE